MSDTSNTTQTALKGGEFLIRETDANDIFIPEEWNEEQKMIAQTCHDFIKTEISPNLDRIDAMEEGLMASLLEKAGELGILGMSVPAELNGMGVDFKTAMLATEAAGAGHSFSVAYGAHTGIGTLPILYYGNRAQREKYIPKLATGEWKACYCLTEPGSGSDANSGKTKAVLTEEGKHYLLNGQKMWITNAGFADIFIVFAKIDNDKNLSAFIVEKGSEGLTLDAEEKKMGIKGSSTRQVFFNDVKIPVENLLYERDKGFKIAINILNIGRIKLAGGAMGGCKETITQTVQYANEREQFGHPISGYGAIQHKLGEMARQVFALESATYRVVQNIDDAICALEAGGMEKGEANLKGIEQFAAECALMKVYGSEVLDFVVDEGVQIHGGMGFSAETNVERAYRDARINRIFEGTNEINRMLAVQMIFKKAMNGELDLMGPAMKVADELMSVPDFDAMDNTPFMAEKKTLANFKKSVLMVAGAAAQKLTTELVKEQEILMHICDMAMHTYVAESVVLRAEKIFRMQGEAADEIYLRMMHTTLFEAAEAIHKAGKEALYAFAEGDEQRMMLMGMRRFTKMEPQNYKKMRRSIAQTVIDANQYCF